MSVHVRYIRKIVIAFNNVEAKTFFFDYCLFVCVFVQANLRISLTNLNAVLTILLWQLPLIFSVCFISIGLQKKLVI